MNPLKAFYARDQTSSMCCFLMVVVMFQPKKGPGNQIEHSPTKECTCMKNNTLKQKQNRSLESPVRHFLPLPSDSSNKLSSIYFTLITLESSDAPDTKIQIENAEIN